MKQVKNPDFIMQRMKRDTRSKLGFIKSHIEGSEKQHVHLYEVMERLANKEYDKIKNQGKNI